MVYTGICHEDNWTYSTLLRLTVFMEHSFLRKLLISQLLWNSFYVRERCGLKRYSHGPSTYPYPEFNEFGPHSPILFKIHFNIVLSTTLKLLSGLLRSGFRTKILYAPRTVFNLISLLVFGEDKQLQAPHSAMSVSLLLLPTSWAKMYFPAPWVYILKANLHSSKSVSIHSFILYCLTTGPQPLPKRVLHTVRSSASSFSSQYYLHFLRSSSSCWRISLLYPSHVSLLVSFLQ